MTATSAAVGVHLKMQTSTIRTIADFAATIAFAILVGLTGRRAAWIVVAAASVVVVVAAVNWGRSKVFASAMLVALSCWSFRDGFRPAGVQLPYAQPS